MTENEPKTNWQIFKTFCLALFAGAGLVWNGWWIVHAMTTGEVETLRRHASYLIYQKNDPQWFGLNIVLRCGSEIFFGLGFFACLRKLFLDVSGRTK